MTTKSSILYLHCLASDCNERALGDMPLCRTCYQRLPTPIAVSLSELCLSGRDPIPYVTAALRKRRDSGMYRRVIC